MGEGEMGRGEMVDGDKSLILQNGIFKKISFQKLKFWFNILIFYPLFIEFQNRLNLFSFNSKRSCKRNFK